MYEDLLTLGFLASFEMLSAAFSPGLGLGLDYPGRLVASIHTSCRGQTPTAQSLPSGARSSISLQLTSVQLSDSQDGWCQCLQDAVSSH